MMTIFRSALILLFATALPAAAQPHALRWGDIVVYQGEILDGVFPDAEELSGYIQRLEEAATDGFDSAPTQAGVTGVLFVAVRPSGRARVWVLPTNGSMTTELQTRLEQRLSALTPVRVRGAFLFGLTFGAWGAAPFAVMGAPPIPAAWEAQIPPEGVILDDAFINRVWPD
jgi:hypothetical protein